MLIKDNDIVTLRKYVRMNFTATAVKSMPDIDSAERKFLIPILSESVFDALQEQVDSNNITWTKLLNLCRASIAPLAVWLDLPFMQINLSDAGLKTIDSDHTQAPHQWEYREIEKALVNKGMAALEDLINHLLKSGADYSWTNADTKESFFRTASDLSPRYVFLDQPNLTFQQIKPLIREVEDHYIKSVIGEDFFAELRDLTTPTVNEKIAIELIKKAVAQYSIVRAVERMPVKITPNGLMASLQPISEARNPEAPAGITQLDKLRDAAERDANSYQQQLMEHLNKYASTTVFITYHSSSYYTTPVVTPVLDKNYYCRRGVVAL